MGAVQKVFDTYELLENILLDLPMKEILLARAVTSSWKTLIECSLPLRRVTFRAPSAAALAVDTKSRLLRDVTRSMMRSEFEVPSLDGTVLRVNPFFSKLKTSQWFYDPSFPVFYVSRSGDPSSPQKMYLFRIDSEASLCSMRSAFWSSTYMTQPPCAAISLHTFYDYNHAACHIYDRTGVTLGQVAELINKALHQISELKSRSTISDPSSLELGFQAKI